MTVHKKIELYILYINTLKFRENEDESYLLLNFQQKNIKIFKIRNYLPISCCNMQ